MAARRAVDAALRSRDHRSLRADRIATYKLLGSENTGQTVNVYGACSHAFLPPRRPSSLTPANVDLKLQPVVNWGASFRPRRDIEAVLNVKHVSAVQTDQENTFALGPYSLVDAAVTWRHDEVRITLSAHNLFDRAYYWNGDGETADPGAARQVLVSASIRVK